MGVLRRNNAKYINRKFAMPNKNKIKGTKKLKEISSKVNLKKIKKVNPTIETNTNCENEKSIKREENSYQKQIDNLKEIDPEFYDFLKKNDKKLLEFNLGDDEISEDDDDDNDGKFKISKGDASATEDEEEDCKYHKLKGQLEVASDESDFENDNDGAEDTPLNGGSQKITLTLLRQWQLQLEKSQIPPDVIRKIVQAFSTTLASILPDGAITKRNANAPFKVIGSAAFNGVIQLCVLHLHPALLRFLGISKKSQNRVLYKAKKWPKVRSCIRCYLTDLIRLIEHISSSNILSVLLKHLHQMAAMIVPFSHLGKNILKRLIVLWSSADETVRVISFLCILKITRNQQDIMLNQALKAMYLSYVRNAKFVSPNTLPAINFMRRSLVEMYTLDLKTSYEHVFLYIRQLAIHLRNAIILKKGNSQTVYNWQYVNALRLWSELLASTYDRPQLQPLVYPFVTITIGVIRLIPTAQYFPLRFHCLQTLIALAKGTNTYIPVLPLILETLRSNTFQRKHTAVSMKPLHFTCLLRLTKNQLSMNGFRDEVVEQVNALCLEYLAHESASLAFSDLVVPTVIALKAYLKQCRNANYTRKLKQLLEKILENANFIDAQRRKINFSLKDSSQIQAWEAQIYNKGTPLNVYYNSWLKMHETKKMRQAAQTDNINDDYNLPSIKKVPKKTSVNVDKSGKGEVELFPSDTDTGADDDHEYDGSSIRCNELIKENEEQEELPKKRSKRMHTIKKQKANKEVQEKNDVPIEEGVANKQFDIVKDLDLDDWY